MQSGYDQRSRFTRRVPYESSLPLQGVGSGYVGSISTRSENVISWRDNIEGQFLDETKVDPYMGYLTSTNEIKYEEQRRVQRELQRAGLPGLPDYEVREFVDNGHVFDKTTDYVNTSLRSQRRYVSYPGQGTFTGFPFCAVGAKVSSSAQGQMPFKMNTSSYLENNFFAQEGYLLPRPSVDELEDYGKRAISIVAPGRPQVDMFRVIGELLVGIPQLPGKALLTKGDFASSGDEWLNMLFGVMPTYKDAIDVGNVLKHITALLFQYRRDAGRIVRRKMEFPVISNSAIFTKDQIDANSGAIVAGGANYGFHRTPYIGGLGDSSSNRVRRDLPTTSEIFMREVRTVKFSGAFTYYIPTTPEFAGKVGRYLKELDRVIGLSPNSVNVYELTPWSWLFDWFVDLRSQLDLAQLAFDDNLVINYGYAMEHTNRSVVCKTELAGAAPVGGVSFASTYLGFERKRRIRANPYGFVGQTGSQGWNPFRWSILAALGISRSR